MSFRIFSQPFFQSAPIAQPKPPPPPPPPPAPPQLKPHRADTFEPSRSSSSQPTTLRTEVLGDGQRNCLEAAVFMARPGDSLVLMDDRRDGSGHALVMAPDGSVRDPNAPGIRYETLGQWQALHPHYQRAATVPADRARAALSIPPGPARDTALRQLGLGFAANVAVADAPEWVTVASGTNVRGADGKKVSRTETALAAEVLGEVDADSVLDETLDTGAGAGYTWYEVRLANGETGYVASSQTSELTGFQTDSSFAELAGDLGAPTAPAMRDSQGNVVQTFENGELTLRPDGTRVVAVEGAEPREVPAEWKSVAPSGGFYNEWGTRMETVRRDEPVQVLRTLSDDEDNNLDTTFDGTWYEVRRQDGSTAFVPEHQFGAMQPNVSVAGLVPPELGAAQGPMLPAEGGGFVQQFENGAVSIDAAGNKTVTGADGQVLAQQEASTVTTLADADRIHVTQRGQYVNGVLTGDAYNSNPEWDGFDDCGPTSVVMAALLVGALDHPGATGTHAEIVKARVALGGSAGDSATTTAAQLETALTSPEIGATVVNHSPASMAAIDAALAAGNPVIAGGYPFNPGAWAKNGVEGYLEGGTTNFAHWVVVSGMTEDGNYIINDPLSTTGPLEVSRAELEAYLQESMGMLEVSPPAGQ